MVIYMHGAFEEPRQQVPLGYEGELCNVVPSVRPRPALRERICNTDLLPTGGNSAPVPIDVGTVGR